MQSNWLKLVISSLNGLDLVDLVCETLATYLVKLGRYLLLVSSIVYQSLPKCGDIGLLSY